MKLSELTHEQIDKLPAGPELDALCAEVLGWRRVQNQTELEGITRTAFVVGNYDNLDWKWPGDPCVLQHQPGQPTIHRVWKPSRNIADVWELVEHAATGDDFIMDNMGIVLHPWAASFFLNGKWIECAAPTAPLAICRAFLKWAKEAKP